MQKNHDAETIHQNVMSNVWNKLQKVLGDIPLHVSKLLNIVVTNPHVGEWEIVFSSDLTVFQ